MQFFMIITELDRYLMGICSEWVRMSKHTVKYFGESYGILEFFYLMGLIENLEWDWVQVHSFLEKLPGLILYFCLIFLTFLKTTSKFSNLFKIEPITKSPPLPNEHKNYLIHPIIYPPKRNSFHLSHCTDIQMKIIMKNSYEKINSWLILLFRNPLRNWLLFYTIDNSYSTKHFQYVNGWESEAGEEKN